MNDFEILITPDRKWKRLALLLKSENMDKQKRKEENKVIKMTNPCHYPSNYNTFVGNSIFMYNLDYMDLEQGVVHDDLGDDFDELVNEVVEQAGYIKNKVKKECVNAYKVFMDNL